MALADTGKAIGAVTRLLVDQLTNDASISRVTVGRPEQPAPSTDNARLNLFLYETTFDASLKNSPLDEGQPPPLWLVLKYLLTGFDSGGESDSIEAHEHLGVGLRALQKLSFLRLNAASLSALNDNPEVLKITFDETPSDLLSKLMQGTDEKYRFSVSFQVRPVMIATGEPPSYSLLVGVDYTTPAPGNVIGEKGIHIPVIPSLGQKITRVDPLKFEANSTITIFGNDLNLSGLSVMLSTAELAVTAQQPNMLKCLVNGNIVGGNVISAGNHPISVVQTLQTGRRRSSNLLIGNLLPRLDKAVTDSLTRFDPTDATSKVFGNIDMEGVLLGTKEDDIFLALYREGKVVKAFDEFTVKPPPPPPPPVQPQTQMRLEIKRDDAVPPGKYNVILRVNGQQAKNSPEMELIVP
jgi:hypothetical protein